MIILKITIWAFIKFEAQIIGPIVKEGWTPPTLVTYVRLHLLNVDFRFAKLTVGRDQILKVP